MIQFTPLWGGPGGGSQDSLNRPTWHDLYEHLNQ
jgi:hypothetical protein